MTDISFSRDWDADARDRDASDPLRAFRGRFYVPDGTIYLDGNSLGLLSRDAREATEHVLDQWREHGVSGWTNAAPVPWFTLAESLAERVGRLVGARPGTVAVTGSTTVNLHQLLATFYDPGRTDRRRILCEALAFPSDRYAIESHLRLRGKDPDRDLALVGVGADGLLDEGEIVAAMTPDVQIAVLPSVVYTTGQLLDVEFITRAAGARGVLVAWDCSHGIGAAPHRLDDWSVDFAFWCHYKYLNAGPGSVGGLYVNRRHWGCRPGLAGWFGSRKDRQFDMATDMTPAVDAGALQIGTPHLLSLAPLDGSLRIHEEAGMVAIRTKSLALTAFLRALFVAELSDAGFGFATPEPDARRGGHLAVTHPAAADLSRALRAAGVVPDFRRPNILRLAPVALYNTFADCVAVVRRLRTILESGDYRTGRPGDELVT